LIKEEGLELGNNKKPVPTYSNVYSVICPVGKEKKFMDLTRKNISKQIEWVDRRNKLFETRVKLIELIKINLDNISVSETKEAYWISKFNNVEFLIKELKKTK
jgi:hypothetical protein